MQGYFDVQLIKKILILSMREEMTQRAIAAELEINLKTVNRYIQKAKSICLNDKDLDLSAEQIAKKISQKRFDGEKLKRIGSDEIYMPKSVLKFASEALNNGLSIATCYRKYLTEEPEKKHYSKDYFRLIVRRYVIEDYNKNFKVSKVWNKDDVYFFSNLISSEFVKVIDTLFCNRYLSQDEAITKSMRMINFISGNKVIYKYINEYISNYSSKVTFALLWIALKNYKNSEKDNLLKCWDSDFYEYKERIIKSYKEKELGLLI